MFFSKLFSRDCKTYREKGDNLFREERYAEARVYYHDALNKIDTASDRETEYDYLMNRLAVTGNMLAELNIVEAETALRGNNLFKAHEHLKLSLELADDVTIREKAEKLLAACAEKDLDETPVSLAEKKHSCAGCSSTDSKKSDLHGSPAEIMDEEQQFLLLVNTLPYPLPERYESMGREFASAYLLAHDEQLEVAYKLFNKLLAISENDIILYELALLEYRAGNRAVCEKYLDRAVKLNDSNPLCYLTLSQLYAESKRFPEAVSILKFMIEKEFLPEQASVMLGDVYIAQGDTEGAIEVFSKGLQIPSLKKVAAERLVEILSSLDRPEEATFIAKSYLKGCC
jgi:tetratricopeptide (TPR) repeat protein